MPRQLFIERISKSDPSLLAAEYLSATTVEVFPTNEEYVRFKGGIESSVAGVEHVSIVGTSNWRFSLNPDKNFKEFDQTSDVDVAVVSSEQFQVIWEAMRDFHRTKWYQLMLDTREQLRRNGENVYSGFVSPMWIPDKQCKLRFQHKRFLNKLRDKRVGYRPVKMLFFKNMTEAIDYYKRGFLNAQRKVNRQ